MDEITRKTVDETVRQMETDLEKPTSRNILLVTGLDYDPVGSGSV